MLRLTRTAVVVAIAALSGCRSSRVDVALVDAPPPMPESGWWYPPGRLDWPDHPGSRVSMRIRSDAATLGACARAVSRATGIPVHVEAARSRTVDIECSGIHVFEFLMLALMQVAPEGELVYELDGPGIRVVPRHERSPR